MTLYLVILGLKANRILMNRTYSKTVSEFFQLLTISSEIGIAGTI